jgi:hypothetical protein
MRSKRIGCCVVLGALATTLGVGCTDTSNPKVMDAPQLQAPPSTELPKATKQGGGPTSSGNSGKNPGASS